MFDILDPTTVISELSMGLAIAALCALLLVMTRRFIARFHAGADAGRGFHEDEADVVFEGLFFIDRDIITDVNVTLCSMLGRARKEIIGTELASFFSPECYSDLRRVVNDRNGEIDAEMMTADRGQIDVAVRAPTVEAGHAVLAVRDISDRKKAERKNRIAVLSDPLTGVGNRALFHERLRQSIEWAQRTQTSVAVFSIDLERLREVNETLGYTVGNGLLMEVAERLCNGTRQIDTVARMSGHMFAIVATLVHRPEDILTMGQRLLKSLNDPYDIEGAAPDVAVCIGITLYPEDTTRTESVLQFADIALARAKRLGERRMCFFSEELDAKLKARRSLETELRQARDRGQFELGHRGMFDSATRQPRGREVTLHWRHPVAGMLPTEELAPLLDETDLIHEAGDWMFATACAAAAALPDGQITTVPLNATQFRRADLAARIGDILARTGLAPDRLECVITEAVLIEDTDRVIETLRALKEKGARVALDDLGSGYTSLRYLRCFPFNTIRIDGALIADLGLNAEADVTVRALLAVGKTLGMDVIAKGVETRGQLALLVAMGCPFAQGPLLDSPAPGEAIESSDQARPRAA